MAHHWVHNSATALDAAGGPQGEGLHARRHGRARAGPPGNESMSDPLPDPLPGPLAGIRVVDVGTRISAPFCAGLLGELGADVIKVELPGEGDFMRNIGPFVPVDDGPDYSLSGPSRAGAGAGSPATSASPRARSSSSGWWRRPTCSARTSGPAPWSAGDSGPPTCLPSSSTCASASSGTVRRRPGPDWTGWASPSAASSTSRGPRPTTRASRCHRVGLPHRHLRRLRRRGGALRARRGGARAGTSIDAPLYGSILRILEWTLAGYDRLGIVRQREGNRLSPSAPLDNYPTADGFFVCIVAGSDANFPRLCKAMERPDLAADPLRHPGRTGGDAVTRSTAWWRSGPLASPPRRSRRRSCGARRPGRHRLQRRRHLRRPPHGGPGRPRGDRRPGHRARPPAGPVPPVGQEPRSRPTRARRCWGSTIARSGATWSAWARTNWPTWSTAASSEPPCGAGCGDRAGSGGTAPPRRASSACCRRGPCSWRRRR